MRPAVQAQSAEEEEKKHEFKHFLSIEECTSEN